MTVAKSIAFSLSFGLEDIDYTMAVRDLPGGPGPSGRMRRSSREDLWRAQPFDPASTVPDASVPGRRSPQRRERPARADGFGDDGGGRC